MNDYDSVLMMVACACILFLLAVLAVEIVWITHNRRESKRLAQGDRRGKWED